MISHDLVHTELPGKLSSKTTLAPIFWPLLEFGEREYVSDHCLICGRANPLNNHHIVRKSAGNIVLENGEKVAKPLITLCGFGNHLRDADGRYYCHGKAHNGLLFFRNNNGRLEYLDLTLPEFETVSSEEITYQKALTLNGWRPIYGY